MAGIFPCIVILRSRSSSSIGGFKCQFVGSGGIGSRFAEANGLKLGQVAQPLRVALTGSTVSPGVFEILAVLGPAEAKARLLAAAG